MKKILFLGFIALFLSACGNSVQTQNQVAVSPTPAAQKPGNELSVTAHTTENQLPPAKFPESGNANNTPSGNSPMSKAIDVTAMTASIERLEKMHQKTPGDLEAKVALADAYFNRAMALTNAAQYRAALGDFRKGLKLNPNDKEAKDMHDQIISVFKSIGREPPKEGEEPAPLPFKKEN
jgi:tetratricopeptide (TPR) repeat protein